MSIRKITARVAAPVAVFLAAFALAAPASAHVTISSDTTAAGSYAVLTVSVPHGCEGSATTKVAIQLPKEINSVTPTRNSLWDVATTTEALSEPITDAHGNEVTERDSVVTYTAKTPLPDGLRDAFELSVQLPDAAGETLVFPIVQTCEQGQAAWTEVAGEGQDSHDLASPAPTLTITEAAGDGHGHADEGQAAEGEAKGDADDDGETMLTKVAAGTGVVALLLALNALVTVRRHS